MEFLQGGSMNKRNFIISVLVMILNFPLLGGQNTRRAIRFDDFIRVRRLSDPQVSPDGKLVAVVVTVMDKQANRGNSDIWLVPSQGGEMRQMTTSPYADYFPRWSPDGKKISFLSTRSGQPQVWVIDVSGGEARPLTSVATGVSSFLWSPTGQHLAFTSSVYPDCADEECNRKRKEAEEKNPVKARLYDRLLFRHWNSWWDGTRSHLFVMPSGEGKAVDLTPGDFDTPPLALGGSQDYVFSPDGAEICFVRNEDPELRLGLGTNNDLFLTSVGGRPLTPITENRANDNQPAYSPDGQFIAYRSMARPGFEADKYTLILLDRKTLQSTPLTSDLDYSVEEMVWAMDSSCLYFTAEEKGRSAVFRLRLATRVLEKILDGHFLTSLRVSPDGKKLFFLEQSLRQPAELVSLDLATKKFKPLTAVNKDLLAELELPPGEEFWFKGASGDMVHGFLLKPPFFDATKKYPLVMLIHGGPQSAWGDSFHYRWNAQMFASPGFVVAMINFHGSTGYGQAFTDSISGDWGGKPFEDIMLGLDYLLAHYEFIDEDRLAAAGASYGGYMINWIMGQTDRFRCLVSHSGVFDLASMYGSTEELWFPEWEFRGTPWTNPDQYQKWSPSSYVPNFKTPCLVIHSANDFRVPLCQGLQLFTALQRRNIPSRLLYFPDEDHFVQKPRNAELWWQTVLEWLKAYLEK